jgi:hypothetical protein
MAQMSEIIVFFDPLSYPDFGRKFGRVGAGNMNFASFLNSDLESLLRQLVSQEKDECHLLFFRRY